MSHRCESCIERLYALGPAPCPICGTTLRKLAFSVQTFEDLQVEKEIAVRKRMAKEYVRIATHQYCADRLSLGSIKDGKTSQTYDHTTIT